MSFCENIQKKLYAIPKSPVGIQLFSRLEYLISIIASAIFASVETWIKSIKVFAVKFILSDSQGFTETLEMHNFALSQEFYRLTNIWILYQSQDIIVGRTGFLFCRLLINTTTSDSICTGCQPICGTLTNRVLFYCAFLDTLLLNFISRTIMQTVLRLGFHQCNESVLNVKKNAHYKKGRIKV